MKIQLVAVTQSLVDGINTAEELLIHIARVSNPGNQMNNETAPKLLRYLINNRHWSPFEQVDLTFKIETSRAITAQILRHWSFRFQEFSQRYAKVGALEPVSLRMKGDSNRQGSLEQRVPDHVQEQFDRWQQEDLKRYDWLVDQGVANESARFQLPISATSVIYMKGAVRSWIHYLKARVDPHAQKEHREIAECIKVIFATEMPATFAAVFGDDIDG